MVTDCIDVLYCQVASNIFLQFDLWYPSNGINDLYDGNGKRTWGTWRIHARGAEHLAWTIRSQSGLFYPLYTCSGTGILWHRNKKHGNMYLNLWSTQHDNYTLTLNMFTKL